MPDEEPDDRGHEAHTVASPSTEPSTWRREAPTVRSIESSRVRWAIVIEKLLKIMNAPTNSATPANTSRMSG